VSGVAERVSGPGDIGRWPQEAIDAAIHEMPGSPAGNRNVLASAVRGLLDAGYVVVPASPPFDPDYSIMACRNCDRHPMEHEFCWRWLDWLHARLSRRRTA
jgi:hypothetical protein